MNKFKMRVNKRLTDELVRIKSFSSDFYKGEQEGINFALYAINSIDEPEKPVLTKEEAEWLEKLTNYYSLTGVLYYITRAGFVRDLFVFELAGETFELPVASGITLGELSDIKERLVNAVLYGYEVEKEKLYTARLKSTGEYLHYDTETDKVHHFFAYGNTAKHSENYHFTKDTLLQYNAWGNDGYDVNEVKGE